MNFICIFGIFAFFAGFCFINSQSDIIVTISQGQLKGVQRENRKGGKFFAFRSIPFAKPPIGDLRFQPPVPADGWEGIRDASPDVPVCYQTGDTGENNTGQEDCLFVNVYSKNLKPTRKLPVMIYYHGGGFLTGSPKEELYNPEFLLTEDIVLVVPAYRLGILGFISFNSTWDNPIKDNPAMRDQILAMKWVQENIAAFGGDSSCVTIFGESAGSTSVHYHLFSPLSRGLFHKVIGQSGVVPISAGIAKRGSAELVAKDLNIIYQNSKDLLGKLQKTTASDLVNAQKKFFNEEFNIPAYNFPVVEGSVPNAFLPKAPEVAFMQNTYHHVPMILGYNDKEGILTDIGNKLSGEYLHYYNASSAIPYNLYLQSEQAKKEVAQKIRNFYFDGHDGNPETDSNQFIDMITDITQLHPLYQIIRKHVINRDQFYFYRFAGNTTLNIIKRFHPATALLTGASHADDIGYLFRTNFTPAITKNSIEDKMIDLMVKMWTSFAKFSDPTPSSRKSQKITKWLPVSSIERLSYYNITNEKPNNAINPDKKRADFWEYIYDTYYT